MANRVSMGTWRKYLPYISKSIIRDCKIVLVNPNSALMQVLMRIGTRTDELPAVRDESRITYDRAMRARPPWFEIMVTHPTKDKSDCVRVEFERDYEKFVNCKSRSINAAKYASHFIDKETHIHQNVEFLQNFDRPGFGSLELNVANNQDGTPRPDVIIYDEVVPWVSENLIK